MGIQHSQIRHLLALLREHDGVGDEASCWQLVLDCAASMLKATGARWVVGRRGERAAEFVRVGRMEPEKEAFWRSLGEVDVDGDRVASAKLARGEVEYGAVIFYRALDCEAFDAVERDAVKLLAELLSVVLHLRRHSRTRMQAFHALDRLCLGAVFLDDSDCVAWHNRRAQEIIARDSHLRISQGRLRASRSENDEQLRAMLSQVRNGAAGPDGAFRVLRRQNGREPLLLVALPVPRAGEQSSASHRGMVTVFMNDMRDESYLLDIQALFQAVYDLTPLKADIASQYINGASIRDIANENRSLETIRSHIKDIYARTEAENNSNLGLRIIADRMLMPLLARGSDGDAPDRSGS